MNQTHPVDKFNSLTEELNHSFVSDLYISWIRLITGYNG